MAQMQAVNYRAADGSEPVDDFIEGLRVPPNRPRSTIRSTDSTWSGITTRHFRFLWSSQVEGEFRELRCHYGSELYRVIYRRSRNLFVLLHMFRKDTGQILEGDKAITRERWADFKARMDAERRLPPRAAGRDAP